ncbi:MAG: alanine--tRNA ligase [Desulfobacterota bacterium]|nr:alanine--tRNA ligase [Thermodesulfobacteriota bacterium]
MKTAAQIRQEFLDFFQHHGHTVVASSPLVPHNDPTLLFTNAGMVQFKDVFLGHEKRPYTRATSAQKCMRAGGKHNDLENVGRTARHHTFFEMLGNFSFGDYFKKEAIAFGWEFITQVAQIDPQRLWVTVFQDDHEAYTIWKDIIGISPERIVRMGEKDNFWAMGDTGPCGPCSEIIIDQGSETGCGRPNCSVGCDCDRYLELWNLVFMQFNRDAQGTMTPLPRPSIDTGMGLERITAVLQHVSSNYDTDLFKPLIAFVAQRSGKAYGTHEEDNVSMRIIADHGRAAAFLVADGVLPSNEGRGYVLRRIMRRAARRAKMLGIETPVLHEVVRLVAQSMQDAYPEVQRSVDYIEKVVLNEEQTFAATLASGIRILEEEMDALASRGNAVIPGTVVFKLYDTYGFPLDLTADIARERGMIVDQEGFDRAMQEQRQRARQAWKGSGEETIEAVYKKIVQDGVRVTFVGYDRLIHTSCIARLVCNGNVCAAATAGEHVEIITEETPFYGESGGQVGDTGTISGEGFTIEVTDTQKVLPELIVHRGRVTAGQVRQGAQAVLQVVASARRATACNHTATHILHAVLRQRLGTHVKQAGSLVTPDRLRFDFTHFAPIDADELFAIEAEVNRRICANTELVVQELSHQEALRQGAIALFGEKYGDRVRVVSIPELSMELCGGTHCRTTGEIGIFKILSEGAVAAGVRRIEAVTGAAACAVMQEQSRTIATLAEMLKTEPRGLVGKTERLLAEQKNLEKEIERLRSKIRSYEAASIIEKAQSIAGVKVLCARVDEHDPKALRSFGDKIRDRMGSGIIVFGAADADKATLLVMVTKDLTKRFSARAIIERIAPCVDGRGGGRNDMAQAGGSRAAGLDTALSQAVTVIAEMAQT